MTPRSFRTLLATTALVAATASRAAADGPSSGLCTPGALNACAALSVNATPFGGGTQFLFRVLNLQGNPLLSLLDNTGGSIIFAVTANFTAATAVANESGFLSYASVFPGSAVISHGAPDGWAWQMLALTKSVELTGVFTGAYVEGCDASPYRGDPFIAGTWETCTYGRNGANKYVDFMFTSTQSFTNGNIESLGFAIQDNNFNLVACGNRSGSTWDFIDTGACAATSVAPEPATVGLVATGLAGLVAIARRRRKAPLDA